MLLLILLEIIIIIRLNPSKTPGPAPHNHVGVLDLLSSVSLAQESSYVYRSPMQSLNRVSVARYDTARQHCVMRLLA